MDAFYNGNRVPLIASLYPFMDTLIVPESGRLDATGEERRVFGNCKQFPDGSPKEPGRHCNFVLDGQLGEPNLFDPTDLDVHFEGPFNEEDCRKVVSGTRWRFLVNEKVRLRGGLCVLSPHILSDPHGMLCLKCSFCRKPYRRLPLINVGVTHWRIHSLDIFGLDVDVDAEPLSAPVELRFILRGRLYSAPKVLP